MCASVGRLNLIPQALCSHWRLFVCRNLFQELSAVVSNQEFISFVWNWFTVLVQKKNLLKSLRFWKNAFSVLESFLIGCSFFSVQEVRIFGLAVVSIHPTLFQYVYCTDQPAGICTCRNPKKPLDNWRRGGGGVYAPYLMPNQCVHVVLLFSQRKLLEGFLRHRLLSDSVGWKNFFVTHSMSIQNIGDEYFQKTHLQKV